MNLQEIRKIKAKNRIGLQVELEDGRICKMIDSSRLRYEKKYDAIETLNLINDDFLLSIKDKFVEIDGDTIKANSQRYQVFKKKGCTCVKCGLVGTYFYKERDLSSHRFHLNLYGVNENGEEILFTKDHIVAKSTGGGNTFTNYQPMCSRCNLAKGTMTQEKFDDIADIKTFREERLVLKAKEYSIDEMFAIIKNEDNLTVAPNKTAKLNVDGTSIHVYESTIKKITKEYLVCRYCGNKVTHFKKEKKNKRKIINAYTIVDGNEMLFLPNILHSYILKKGCCCFNCNQENKDKYSTIKD